ncbi:hypothetical protein VPH35_115211 [Triticum aestivum]|nr:increased rDNA silencing protein 4 [Aegilops tauschii subsp. strangulata]XP_044418180.1 increased rDNA silencing protein 4-like [Triticum aestivum]
MLETIHGRVSCCEKLPSSGRAPMLPEEALSCSPARASCGFFARAGSKGRALQLEELQADYLLWLSGVTHATREGSRHGTTPPPWSSPRLRPTTSPSASWSSASIRPLDPRAEQPYPPPRPPTKSRLLPVMRSGGGRPRGAPIHPPPWSSPCLRAGTSPSASIRPPRRPDHQPSAASCLSCGCRSNNKNCRVLYVKTNRFFGLAT